MLKLSKCTLPGPGNLKRWGPVERSDCPLCSRTPVGACHILERLPNHVRRRTIHMETQHALYHNGSIESGDSGKFVKSGKRVDKNESEE